MSCSSLGNSLSRPVVRELRDRAVSYAEQGAYEAALTFFRAVVAVDPSPVSRLTFAVFLFENGEIAEAETELRTCWNDARRLSDPRLAALAAHNLSVLCRHEGQRATKESGRDRRIEAEQFCQWACNAWFRSPEAAGEGLPSWLRRLQAAFWMDAGEDDEAHKLLLSALPEAEPGERVLDEALRAWSGGDGKRAAAILEAGLSEPGVSLSAWERGELLERCGLVAGEIGNLRVAGKCFAEGAGAFGEARHFGARARCRQRQTRVDSLLALLDADPARN